jgi:hypothetical protein
MTGTRKDARTHVDEWAELVGNEVPESALEERALDSLFHEREN